MKVAVRFLFLLLLCVAAALPADAGKNAGGALIVHANDAVGYRGSQYFCLPQHEPASCEEAVTRTDHVPDQATFMWFLAAFPELSEPAVSSISFGVRHNLPAGEGYVAYWLACGSVAEENSEPGFPDIPGGDRLHFTSPVNDRFFQFYCFGVYGFAGVYLGSGRDPRLGEARFTDDSVPPVEDTIERFGEVRWYEEGYNQCPSAELTACCLPSGACVLQPEENCIADGGKVYPDFASCLPSPCGPAMQGACCIDESCSIRLEDACENLGGGFQGVGSVCDPDPCIPRDGACCILSGCLPRTEVECANEGGDFLGVGVPCEPVNPCPRPGACCLPDGSCSVFHKQPCLSAGGIWFGPDIACESVVCRGSAGTPGGVPGREAQVKSEMAVTPTTWGRIRAVYR